MRSLPAKKFIGQLLLLCLLTALAQKSVAQIGIMGPVCVAPGLTYQYNFDGLDTGKISICVEGGTIVDTSVLCLQSVNVSFIRVQWNRGANGTNITVSSPEGTTVYTVQIAAPLQGGSIDTSVSQQYLQTDSLPATLVCTAASGGVCQSSYAYEWQESPDNVAWTNIAGAQSQNLAFISPISQTTFYRRKVTEIHSATVTYSDVAALYVIATADEGGGGN